MSGAETDIATLEALEERRYAAMLAADLATLDELLHDEMIYSHSTGGMDSKQVYLAALRDKVSVYKRVVRDEQTVRVTGDVGLVFNHIQIEARHKGVDLYLDNRMLAVWLREGGVWRLLAIQSGAIPRQSV